jgi:hypothetical protein
VTSKLGLAFSFVGLQEQLGTAIALMAISSLSMDSFNWRSSS